LFVVNFQVGKGRQSIWVGPFGLALILKQLNSTAGDFFRYSSFRNPDSRAPLEMRGTLPKGRKGKIVVRSRDGFAWDVVKEGIQCGIDRASRILNNAGDGQHRTNWVAGKMAKDVVRN